MKTFAFCCASFAEVTERAAGVTPLTSPPVDAGTFNPTWLEGYDLLWFDLHGQPGAGWWMGDDRLIAVTAGQIRDANLGGAIVFALNCYLADEGSPMLDALLDAGARYVIGGDGRNWAGQRALHGAAILGMRFVEGLREGQDPLRALALAKRRVRLSMVRDWLLRRGKRITAAKDTLAFRAYYRRSA